MPNLQYERLIQHETGLAHIAGLDEAGRGALAGPVVAAAVILPLAATDLVQKLRYVDDSKRLTSKMRGQLFEPITTNALCYGIGSVGAAMIDEIGIIPATKLAMFQALSRLDPEAQYLLIDGRIVLRTSLLPQKALIRGDSKSLSIAAASILAKVTRDRLMEKLDVSYPAYGFARHKGYGTEFHREAIAKLGPIREHRYSFAPIRSKLI